MPDTTSEWRPIETAPKDGLAPDILLGCFNDEFRRPPFMFVARWYDGRWANPWGLLSDHPAEQPTHWMPLPAPPTTNHKR